MSYPAIKSMADVLARSLADPLTPTVCPYCLVSFADSFRDPSISRELKEHIPRLRVDCHALFDACIATLTRPRTSEEMDRLALTLAANRRRCSTHRATWRPFNSEQYLDSLMASATNIFTMAVYNGQGTLMDRAEKANKRFGDKKGRWPTHVEQLFPDGVEAAVEVLLGYSELYISDGPLCMLSEMVVLARPVIMPVLAADPFRTRLVSVVLKMLDPVASGITGRMASMDGQNYHGLICHMLDALRTGPGARPDDCARFFAGHESALLRLLGRVGDRLEDDDPKFITISYCCNELADYCNDPLPPSVVRWYDKPGRCRCRKKVTATTIHSLVVMSKAVRICAGPGCTLSTFQNADGKPFQACARCRVPRYCSRACQLADWKGTPLHKDLCAVFCKLNAHTCERDKLPQFEATFLLEEPNFSDKDREALAAFVASDCEHSRSSVPT